VQAVASAADDRHDDGVRGGFTAERCHMIDREINGGTSEERLQRAAVDDRAEAIFGENLELLAAAAGIVAVEDDAATKRRKAGAADGEGEAITPGGAGRDNKCEQ